MSRTDRLIMVGALLVGLLCLGGAAAIMPRINQERSVLQLTVTDDAREGAPPELAWINLLGAFKGLAIDALWIRIEDMKNEGRYHEAMQLSEWITTLQPRFPAVWADRAWNLSYNISVGTHSLEERWMWVEEGIKLLRDKGIPANPKSVPLYKELSWIFLHKVGQFSDDSNWYYKRKLAERWHYILGAPPTEDDPRVHVEAFRPIADAFEAYFRTEDLSVAGQAEVDRAIAEAPILAAPLRKIRQYGLERLAILLHRLRDEMPDHQARLDRILKQVDLQQKLAVTPTLERLRQADPEAATLAEAARAQGLALDAKFLEAVIRTRTLMGDSDAGIFGVDAAVEMRDNEKWVGTVIASPQAAVLDRLVTFVRAKVLVEDHHMNPSWMFELMRGEWFIRMDNRDKITGDDIPRIPLDWRHPCAHGLYWASLGVSKAAGLLRPQDADILNTDRNMIHALQGLRQTGRIIFDPVSGYISMLPDPRYTEAYHQGVTGVNERVEQWTSDSLKRLVPTSFLAGHENFLSESVVMEYMYGSQKQAEKYYAALIRLYSDMPGRKGRYDQDLETYVLDSFVNEQSYISLENASAAVDGMFFRYINDGLINGKMDVANRFLSLARYLHKRYSSKQDVFGAKIGEKSGRHRMSLPYDRMFTDAFLRYTQGLIIPRKARA